MLSVLPQLPESARTWQVDEAEDKIGGVVRPVRDFLKAAFLPVRNAVLTAPAGEMPTVLGELAERVRSKLR